MKFEQKHIITRFFALMLLVTILAPSVVKGFHALSNHEHQVCLENVDTHFHNIDLDCEFYKFHINQSLNLTVDSYEIYEPTEIHLSQESSHDFLSDFQKLHFSLRAPPSL